MRPGWDLDSARGDGLCSIWSILIGWSALGQKLLIQEDNNLVTVKEQPSNIWQIMDLIGKSMRQIMDLMGPESEFEMPLKNKTLKFYKWALDHQNAV